MPNRFNFVVLNNKVRNLTPYQNRVLAAQPIRYWPLDDAVGSSSARELVVGASGTPVNVVFGAEGLHGKTSAYFGGNAYINIYSAALNAAFTGNSFTLLVWAKRDPNVGWNDATNRAFLGIGNGTPTFYGGAIRKNNSNQIYYNRTSSTGDKNVQESSIDGDTDYGYGLSVSEADGTLKAFRNGAQIGSTVTSIGAWGSAALRTVSCTIGAVTTTPTSPMSGYLHDVAIFCPAISDTLIKALTSR